MSCVVIILTCTFFYERYMTSALEGRLVIQKTAKVPALLAPVHDLTHHIHVMNALAREAEYVKPIQFL